MGNGKTRPVMIKLRSPGDKSIIFSNASKLKNKENVKGKMYFIHEDMTDEQAENCKHYKDLMVENVNFEEEKKFKIRMTRGEIMVNNEKVKPKIFVHSQTEILRLSEKQLEVIRATKIARGPEHMEKGSKFLSYATTVQSLSDVTHAYQKLKVKHADATLISCAYRLDNPIGPYRQQSLDDGDCGIGCSILKVMKQQHSECMAVFIVRYYGKIHLGKQRFEIVEQLSKHAMTECVKKSVSKSRKSRLQRVNSQSSLQPFASAFDSQDEFSDENITVEMEQTSQECQK